LPLDSEVCSPPKGDRTDHYSAAGDDEAIGRSAAVFARALTDMPPYSSLKERLISVLPPIMKLQRKIDDLTEILREKDRTLESLGARFASFDHALRVPIDHPDVCRPRRHEYLYPEVEKAIRTEVDKINEFVDRLRLVMYGDRLNTVPKEKVNERDPYWNNGYFSGDDARIAYAVAAELKPRRIIELGSGNSTKFFRKAISDYSIDCRLISIDPAPRAEIDDLVDEIHRTSLLDVPVEMFRTLERGDVLFFDGSHLVFNGTDSTALFLEVLPALKSGVLVHVHDIDLPNEYQDVFTERRYGEQYLLAVLLIFSSQYGVRAPVHWLTQRGLINEGGVSFWMERN
jgi:Methyltransferase domain